MILFNVSERSKPARQEQIFILNLYKIEISLSIRNDSEMSQICGVCSTTEVLVEPRLLLEPNEVASSAR